MVRAFLAMAVACTLSTQAMADPYLVDQRTVSTTAIGQSYGLGYASTTFNLPDQFAGVTYGTIVDAGVAGKYGAEAHAGVSVQSALTASLQQTSTFNNAWKTDVTTLVYGADNVGGSFVGDSFYVGTLAQRADGSAMGVHDTGVTSDISLRISAQIEAGASACLAKCAGLKINIGPGIGTTQSLASFSSAGGGYASVLDHHVGSDVFPLEYTDPTNSVSAYLNPPEFSGNVHADAASDPLSYSSRQGLASIYANAAQIFATAIGLPFNLSGNLGGFDYEILGAYLGAGIDIVHNFSVNVEKVVTQFDFTSPVQVWNDVTGDWGAEVKTFIRDANGPFAKVRAADATNIGMTTKNFTIMHYDADWAAVPFVSAQIRALSVDGYGVSLGPLIDYTQAFDLGSIPLGTDSGGFSMFATGATMNLAFNQYLYPPGGFVTDQCEIHDCRSTAFITTDTDEGEGVIRTSALPVQNYGTRDCNDIAHGGCIIDTSRRPVVTRKRAVTRVRDAGLVVDVSGTIAALDEPIEYEYADDFTLVDAVQNAVLTGGAESNDAARLARLDGLSLNRFNTGAPPTLGPGRTEGDIDTTDITAFDAGEVPEPAMLGMFGLGAGGLLLTRRRRVRSSKSIRQAAPR